MHKNYQKTKVNGPIIWSVQSGFLEAPLVRQADGELKKFPMCRILILADIRPSFLFSGMHSKTKLAIYNYTANKYVYM